MYGKRIFLTVATFTVCTVYTAGVTSVAFPLNNAVKLNYVEEIAIPYETAEKIGVVAVVGLDPSDFPSGKTPRNFRLSVVIPAEIRKSWSIHSVRGHWLVETKSVDMERDVAVIINRDPPLVLINNSPTDQSKFVLWIYLEPNDEASSEDLAKASEVLESHKLVEFFDFWGDPND